MISKPLVKLKLILSKNKSFLKKLSSFLKFIVSKKVINIILNKTLYKKIFAGKFKTLNKAIIIKLYSELNFNTIMWIIEVL